jgi:folate-dependent phosphoribosylglycinamide formyltransferase PurN
MRLVIVTNGNFFARVILGPLIEKHVGDIAGIVIVTGVKAGKSRIHSLFEIWQQSGGRYFFYKFSTYMVFALAELLFRKRAYFVSSLAARHAIPIMYTAQVKSLSVEKQISEWQSDILISVSCPQRIRQNLLDLPAKCSINIHSSLLPAYAGIAPYFWVLANNEQKTGTTVHIMEEQFDTGEIIVQKECDILAHATVLSLFLTLSLIGSTALEEAINGLISDSVSLSVQDYSGRSYHSWPTMEAMKSLHQHGFSLARLSDYLTAIRSVK